MSERARQKIERQRRSLIRAMERYGAGEQSGQLTTEMIVDALVVAATQAAGALAALGEIRRVLVEDVGLAEDGRSTVAMVAGWAHGAAEGRGPEEGLVSAVKQAVARGQVTLTRAESATLRAAMGGESGAVEIALADAQVHELVTRGRTFLEVGDGHGRDVLVEVVDTTGELAGRVGGVAERPVRGSH